MPAPITPSPTHGAPAAGVSAGPRGDDNFGPNDRVHVLTDAARAELAAARDAVRRGSLPLLGVGRADFPLPGLGPELARLADELDGAPGYAVVRGLPVNDLSEADLRLVLWGLGRHVGVPVSQDSLGHMIGLADTSRHDFHSGGSDVTALLVRGEARAVSLADTGRIMDKIVLERPDLAMRLFDTFHHDRMGEEGPGEKPFRSVPLACRHVGRLSLRYDRCAVERAQRLVEVPRLSAEELALLDLIDETAASPAVRQDLVLEAGDLLLVNNYQVLHRHVGSPFPGAPGVLRLWLTLRHGRALPAAFSWPTPAYGETGGRGGIAPRDVIHPNHAHAGRAISPR